MDVNRTPSEVPRKSPLARALRMTAATVGVAAGGYAAATAVLWARYGHPNRPKADQQDPMLDHFMPEYDVVERHQISIDAPADITLAAAAQQDLMRNTLVRAIFNTRALVLGGNKEAQALPHQLLPLVRSLGWRVLAESDTEIVVGAVTKPWQADVTFRGLDPDAFTTFNEPDYVKIVWSLRADPLTEGRSMFRTETRAIATDEGGRAKFRRYWALASPGIWLIRRASLRPLKFKAEHRARKQENGVRWPEYHAG